MNIALLADHIEVIHTLANWYRNEWQPYYGADGPGDALADLGLHQFGNEFDDVARSAKLDP